MDSSTSPASLKLTHPIKVGTRIQFDGDQWRVSGFIGHQVQCRSRHGHTVVHDLSSVVTFPDFKVITGDKEDNYAPVVTFTNNVAPEQVKEAQRLLGHLNEAECGYTSGNKATALPHEPRYEYDPDRTTLAQRHEIKAKELGISARSIRRHISAYRSQGLFGLIDQRQAKLVQSRTDTRVIDVMRTVLTELRDKSNVTRKFIVEQVVERTRQLYPDGSIEIPSQITLYRLLKLETKGTGAFGAAKARRSIANRPKGTYKQMVATRPGEVVLIDSTPFDAFALDPVTFQWIQLQLTIALDLFSRSIVAWRFTPVSTKAVDAALLLYDIIRPKLMQPGWPERARWPYIGVPESIIIELAGVESANDIAGVPVLHPESIVVDHGKVFISQAFKDACTRLGINLQLARPYTPTDKAQVERVFRTIRENFVMALPGYKGPDIFSRGLDVENDAFYFLDEIDAKLACWIAAKYQCRPHGGLSLPGIPHLEISPNEMYEEGIARAGFVHVVATDLLYYELLPTDWRTVQHYGIEFRGLRYDADILDNYTDKSSPYGGLYAEKWPIRYDPRDLSRIFFFDEDAARWYEIDWTHHNGENRPFNEATLSHAKALLIKRGGNPADIDELSESLNSLLDRIGSPDERSRKERRLAAINAMHASLAKKDAPAKTKAKPAPDAEVNLFVDGPTMGAPKIFDEAPSQDDADIAPLRSIDEAMEDDDDAYGI